VGEWQVVFSSDSHGETPMRPFQTHRSELGGLEGLETPPSKHFELALEMRS